jgi:hypothetical protein
VHVLLVDPGAPRLHRHELDGPLLPGEADAMQADSEFVQGRLNGNW